MAVCRRTRRSLPLAVVVGVVLVLPPMSLRTAAAVRRADATTCARLFGQLRLEGARLQAAADDYATFVLSKVGAADEVHREYAARLKQWRDDAEAAYRSVHGLMVALSCNPANGRATTARLTALPAAAPTTPPPAAPPPSAGIDCAGLEATAGLLDHALNTALGAKQALNEAITEEAILATVSQTYAKVTDVKRFVTVVKEIIARRRADIERQRRDIERIQVLLADVFSRSIVSGCDLQPDPAAAPPATATAAPTATSRPTTTRRPTATTRSTTRTTTRSTTRARNTDLFPGATVASVSFGAPQLAQGQAGQDPSQLLRAVECLVSNLVVLADGRITGDCTRTTRADVNGWEVGPGEPFDIETIWKRTASGSIDLATGKVAFELEETLWRRSSSAGALVEIAARFAGSGAWVSSDGTVAVLRGTATVAYQCARSGSSSAPPSISCGTERFTGMVPFTMSVR